MDILGTLNSSILSWDSLYWLNRNVENSIASTLDFRKANLNMLKKILVHISWSELLKRRELRWSLCASYKARSTLAQQFRSSISFPLAARSTYCALHTDGVLLSCCCSDQCWRLASPFAPPQAADRPTRRQSLPCSGWVVSCLEKQGRASKAPLLIGMVPTKKDPCGMQSPVSGPHSLGGGMELRNN